MTTRRPHPLAVVTAPVLLLLLLALGMRYLPTLLSADGAAATNNGMRGGHPLYRLPTPAPVDAFTQNALEKIIHGQLSAFRRQDYARALTYAAEDFRSRWSAEQFGKMIQSGYPGLTHAGSEKFEKAQLAGEIAQVPVTIVEDKGQSSQFLYLLQRDAAGWLIFGCRPIQEMEPGQRLRGRRGIYGDGGGMSGAPPMSMQTQAHPLPAAPTLAAPLAPPHRP